MTAVSKYELAVWNIFIFNMLIFQYIILVIGTSRLSLPHGLKTPNRNEIVYGKYRESLSYPHPPMHDNIVIWRYETQPYRPILL